MHSSLYTWAGRSDVMTVKVKSPLQAFIHAIEDVVGRHFRVTVLTVAGLLSALPTCSFAVPVARYNVYVQSGSTNPGVINCAPTCQIYTAGTLTSNGASARGSGNSTASARSGPDPTVYARGTITAGPNGQALGNAQIIYYFEVIGPIANVVVPVNFSAKLSANMIPVLGGNPPKAGTDLTATAEMVVIGNDQSLGSKNQQRFNSFPDCNIAGGCGVANVSSTISMLSGNGGVNDPGAGNVNIFAGISGVSQPYGGTATAAVEPILYISPSFLAANPDYSLEFSQGIINTPAIPEPSSNILFAVGLICCALFRTRAQQEGVN